MYGLMVAFDPTRATEVSGGQNKGMNFGNVAAKPITGGDRDHDGSSATARNIECWRCGGDLMKSDFPIRAEEKEKEKVQGRRQEQTRRGDGGRAAHNVHLIRGRTVRDRI